MKSTFKKALEHIHEKLEVVTPQATSATPTLIALDDVYRYRKQHGLNLGSWFVLERWICDRPFARASPPAQSDLDVARGPNAKEILATHWDTWIVDEDWKWIADRGINSVRIPIGYYHICGADPTVLNGTDFYPFYNTYAGAWKRVVRAIEKASSHSIGVLIDLHAAPGKQNNDAHAGTSDGANFFGDAHNQRVTIHVLRSLSTALKSIQPPPQNIIGIELLNEPAPPSDHALQSWYTSAIAGVNELDPTLPIYLGECWRTDAYAEYIAQHHSASPGLTVLDHHLYRCFNCSDIHTSAQDHMHALADPNGETPKMLERVSERLGRAGGGVIVGEWSGALNPGGVFPSFVGVRRRDLTQEDVLQHRVARDLAKSRALAEHTQYWARYPGKYNHQRFADGFCCGWDDAYNFILLTPSSSKTISEIGFGGAWARRRTSDYGRDYWEFEHGFMQGMKASLVEYQSM